MKWPAALLFCALSITLAQAAEIVPLAGKPIKGTLVAIDTISITVKDTDGKELKIPVKDMASVDLGGKVPNLAEKKYDEFEFIDGSIVRSAPGSFLLKGEKGECTPLTGTIEAPTILIPTAVGINGTIYYLMRDAEKPINRLDWKKLLANKGKRDLVVIREKLETGERLNQLEGTVLSGNEKGDRISFEQTSGEKADLPLNRFSGGIVFNQPPRKEIPPTICRAIDTFGNSVFVTSVALDQNGGVKIVTVSGVILTYPKLEGIAQFDFRQGNVKYLGEFEPIVEAPKQIEGEPYFTFTRDKTASGGPLRIDGKVYAKGLWVFPDTALRFPLNGDYKTFKVWVGIDESVQVATSAVRVVIEADGRKLFNEVVTRKDKGRELTLDVKDAKELKIIIERDALYAGNQVNLGDARVQK